MKLTTYKFRIKDSNSRKKLVKMGYAVNFVFNYCNEVNQERWKKFHKTFSAFDLNNLTSGCAKDLELHSETVQAVCEEYDRSRKQHKKIKLNWRSRKKSLGWIPFKAKGVKVSDDRITYKKQIFKFWESRKLPGKVRFGSFNQDSKGNWFVNLICEDTTTGRTKTGKSCGIDLGLKTLVTLSDGIEFSRENLTRKHAIKLTIAQRANKKKQVTRIHARIKNQRKDWNHKVTSLLTTEYDQIIVGNVRSSKLTKTRMAKSVNDAGWYDFKQMLAYKSIRIGSEFKEVNESFSTVTCSGCNERTGPKGVQGLKVREWICEACGSHHLRDVNAAKNILRIGHDTLLKESLNI